MAGAIPTNQVGESDVLAAGILEVAKVDNENDPTGNCALSELLQQPLADVKKANA